MLDTFNDDVRRVAQLLAYEQPTDGFPPTLIKMAKLYNEWAPFDMPKEAPRFSAEASGEFTAR
jgi:hypothetical protein